MTKRLPVSRLIEERPIWLLEVSVAGRSWRWASETIDVEDATNSKTYHYDSGIDPAFSQSFELLSESSELESVSFSLFWPESAADLHSRGFDFSSGTGELSLIFDGDDYADRFVLIKGQLDAPEIGYDDEPVSFSIRDNGFQDLGNLLDEGALISALTWSSSRDEAADGRYYPLILGSPGKITNAERTKTTGAPAIGVLASGVDSLVFAAGRVATTSVQLINQTDGTSETVSVAPLQDNEGRVYSGIVAHTSYSAGDQLFTRWDFGGGVPRATDPSTAMDGAGEILLWALQRSTLRIDFAAFEAVSGVLDQYKIATYIDQPVSPWEWASAAVIPILPISIVAGPDGLRPILWSPYATIDDVIATLTEGMDCSIESPIQFESTDVINQYQLKYALRADNGEYLLKAAVGPEGVSLGSSVTTNIYATSSYQTYGLKQAFGETNVVYDKPTAIRIAGDRVRANCFRRRSITVSVSWKYGWLRLGDRVELSAPSYYLEAQLCTVTRIQLDTTEIRLTLLLESGPLI